MDERVLRYLREAAKTNLKETTTFIYRKILRLKYAEIAEEMGIECNAVSVHIHKAQIKFFEFLNRPENKDLEDPFNE